MKELMRAPNPRSNGGLLNSALPKKTSSSDTLSVMTPPAKPHTQSDIVEVKTCLDRLAQLLQHHAPRQTLQPETQPTTKRQNTHLKTNEDRASCICFLFQAFSLGTFSQTQPPPGKELSRTKDTPAAVGYSRSKQSHR